MKSLQHMNLCSQECGHTIVQKTPYSTVVQLKTSHGQFYLKQTPPLLALESDITKLLHYKFSAKVPEVIASSKQYDCFLMRDAGIPLRQVFKSGFDLTLMNRAIEQFVSMQVSVQEYINDFISLGVPDWRIENIPDLFESILIEKDILEQDGMTNDKYISLIQVKDKLHRLCQLVTQEKISETIVQPDFQDNNSLFDKQSNTVSAIDLGEIVIAHPLFSLIGCLYALNRYYDIQPNQKAYQLMKQTYFYTLDNKKSLREWDTSFDNASILWQLYSALAQYRLRLACDEDAFLAMQRPGKLTESLNCFTTLLKNNQSI